MVKAQRGDDEDINANPMNPLKRGYVASLLLASLEFTATCYMLLNTEQAPNAWKHFVGCGAIGIVTSYVFVLSTQYYTDYAYNPVQSISQASTTGHGTNIIAGFSVGMKATTIPAITVSMAVVISYHLGMFLDVYFILNHLVTSCVVLWKS